MVSTGGGEVSTFRPELAGLLLSEETVSSLLTTVVNLAVSAVAGVDEASISMAVSSGARFETPTASSAVIRTVDEGQYRDNDGPCVEAIRTGCEIAISLPAKRWPIFSERATRAEMRAVLSLPLQVQDRTTGALNLYSKGEGVKTPATDVARALAAQAAIVLANAAVLTSAELTNRHLEEALISRDLIGQAKGILMAHQDITADEAFTILVHASQRTGRKLRDVAAEIAAGRGQPREV